MSAPYSNADAQFDAEAQGRCPICGCEPSDCRHAEAAAASLERRRMTSTMSKIIEAGLWTVDGFFEGVCGLEIRHNRAGVPPYRGAVAHVDACGACRTWCEQVTSGEIAIAIARGKQ